MVKLERLESRSGHPTLRAELAGGRKIFLHSAYNPAKEARNWAEKLEPKENCLIVLFGLGLGYHLKALLRKVNPEQTVIVFEPDPGLRRSFSMSELKVDFPFHSKIWVIGDWEALETAFERSGTVAENVFFCKNVAAAQVYSSEFKEFTRRLSNEMKDRRANLATVISFADTWQGNFIKNLRYADRSGTIGSGFGGFQGKPAIIVSAGPSLSKNVEQLRRAKGKALIFAVGTASRLLLRKGIVPDLVATFDGGDANYERVFKDLGLPPDVPLIYDPVCQYRIVEKHPGPLSMMLVHGQNSWLDDFYGRSVGLCKVGGSIANTTFDIALRFGADPIIFVGQDLAYTDDQLHAEGTLEKIEYIGEKEKAVETERKLKSIQRIVMVEGIDGKPIKSNLGLETFLRWFEREIEILQDNRTIIDATEGGARIRGTQLMTLSETVDRYCCSDFRQDIEELKSRISDPGDFDGRGFRSYIEEINRSMSGLIPEAQRGVRLSQKLLDHFTRGKNCRIEKVLGQLDRTDRRLKRAAEDMTLVRYFLEHLEVVRLYHAETGRQEEDIATRSLRLYSKILESLELGQPMIEELSRTLAERAEEASVQGSPRSGGVSNRPVPAGHDRPASRAMA